MARDLTPLCELAKKYETDKGGRHFRYNGGPCEQCHEYTQVYWDILKNHVESTRRVLEIGINSGASLRMWEEFFPHAEIIGFDVNPDYLFNAGRIRCFQADQSDVRSLQQAVIPALPPGELFDLIIDDGSHQLKHQIRSFYLLQYLSPTGLYIVEDVEHPQALCDAVPNGFGCVHVGTDNNRGGVDHLVIIAHV
jgi:predicted O-methyltransferase YrrM